MVQDIKLDIMKVHDVTHLEVLYNYAAYTWESGVYLRSDVPDLRKACQGIGGPVAKLTHKWLWFFTRAGQPTWAGCSGPQLASSSIIYLSDSTTDSVHIAQNSANNPHSHSCVPEMVGNALVLTATFTNDQNTLAESFWSRFALQVRSPVPVSLASQNKAWVEGGSCSTNHL